MLSPLLFSALLVAQTSPHDPQAERVVSRFIDAVASLNRLTYEFEQSERFRDGRVISSRHAVKQRMPHTLYVRRLSPSPGQEILFDPTVDPVNLIVHPNGFPYITLHLDHRGSRATGDSHHIATHMGYRYTASLLQKQLTPERDMRFGFEGDGLAAGVQVVWITLQTDKLPPRAERANEDEILLNFAERVGCDPFWLAYNNPDLSDELTQELDARVYIVPRGYGARTRMAFSRDTGLLIEQFTYDHAGELYEHYIYRNVVKDPTFAATEFSTTHPGYDF